MIHGRADFAGWHQFSAFDTVRRAGEMNIQPGSSSLRSAKYYIHQSSGRMQHKTDRSRRNCTLVDLTAQAVAEVIVVRKSQGASRSAGGARIAEYRIPLSS